MAVMLNFCMILLVFFSFHPSHAQIASNISLGTSITAGDSNSTPWLSLSGDYAFGFYPLSSGLYLLGIWFDKIQEKTLIWSTNRDNPAGPGSIIRLTFAGQLVLRYDNGSNLQVYSGAAASLGFMQNDGNFVLRDSNSLAIWESFKNPTNTILPGQVVSERTKLYSNAKGTTDYSTGNFMLQMQDDGNLVLSAFRFSDPGYFFTAYDVDNKFNVSLVFNQTSALMYLVNNTNHNIIHALTTNFSARVEEYYHRATINDYGNFQQYRYHRSNGSSWIKVWEAIAEPCFVNAICGVNGFCTSPDNKTVSCGCIPGYVHLDLNNPSKGCRPEVPVNYCADSSMRNFTVEVIHDADFPYEDSADLARVLNVDVEGCKKALMDDCYSLAAVLIETRCNKKRMPLLNARKSNSTIGITAFVKVPNKFSSPGPDATQKKKSHKRYYIKKGLIASSVFAFLFGAIAIYYHPIARQLVRSKWSPRTATIGDNFREFTYQELREATHGFSRTLGRGASGKVYSGTLTFKDTEIEIAVKKLDRVTERGEIDFLTELGIIGQTYHKNLVRLLGFCIEDDQWILVCELMKNGTLSDLLFGNGEVPGWSQRLGMALGIARGLLYLHEECETQIIHCDMKPQNVLLDIHYNTKIADFGLSKLLDEDQSRTNTRARGTAGYMAPEWLRNAPITAKVDIYSFGVMLLEISCGRRHIEPSRIEEESEEDDLILTDWVLICIKSARLEMLVRHDPDVLSDIKRFERVLMVALWCVHPDPVLRPSMKKVTQMLEGAVEVGIPPLIYDK